MSSIQELKKKVVLGCRILYSEGTCGNFPFGHLSVRHPDRDKFVIPYKVHGEGRHLGEVVMDDLQILNLDGEFVDGAKKEFFDEIFAHSEIYRAREDVMAIAHVHPPVTKSMVASRVEIYPVLSQATVLSSGVRIFEPPDGRPRLIGTKDDGVMLARALGNAKAVAIRGLAIDVTGSNVEDAVTSAVLLEENAKMQLIGMQVGKPVRFERVPMPPRPPGSPPPASQGRNLMWTYYVRRLMRSEWAVDL